MQKIHTYISYGVIGLLKKLSIPAILTVHDAMTVDYGKYTQGINTGDFSMGASVSYKASQFKIWRKNWKRFNPFKNYIIKYQFKKLYIVAHSMGGLVARSTIKKYLQTYPELADSIQLLITINSPLAGMQSTEKVERLPIIIPSWRDLKPKSQFLSDLNSWFLPHNIPYHLVFSYHQCI